MADKRIQRLNRFREIATALARNGFGFVSDAIGLTDKLTFIRKLDHKEIGAISVGVRIRQMLEELGPTFVKLGQIASTRPDLVPKSILTELEQLQDHVAPFPLEEAINIIEVELGSSIESLFSQFSEAPLASASIGQVYKAQLNDGTEVAVKVRRPGVQSIIETDLELLSDLSKAAEAKLDWAKKYSLSQMIDELARAIRLELNYEIEARNMRKFAQMCSSWKHIHVPKVYMDYSTKQVMTMEFVEGIKLSNLEQLDAAGLDRKVLAERFASHIFQQAFIEGFFHGDPHPGNILAHKNGDLVFLDFGMVGRLTPGMKKNMASFIIALRNQSTKGVIRAISKMGVTPEGMDKEALFLDADALREKYYDAPLSEMSLGEAVQDLFQLAFLHQIRIPAELTLLGKSLLTLEGVVTGLDPTFSVMKVAEPFGKKMFMERFNPKQYVKEGIENIPELIDLLHEIPTGIKQLFQFIHKGKVRAEVSIPQIEELMMKMDRISNRLSFSIVLLSLSIIIVGLIIGAALNHSQTILWNLPFIETGFIIALLMAGWLIYSIFRSGRF